MKLKLFLVLLLSINYVKAQLTPSDFASRRLAETVANSVLRNCKPTPYVIFSVADKRFILIKKEGERFREYFAILKDSQHVEVKKSLLLNKVKGFPTSEIFDFKLYSKDYITFASDFYKNGYKEAKGGMIYFVVVDISGIRYGETKISFVTVPSPIPRRVYPYFVDRTFYYSKIQ